MTRLAKILIASTVLAILPATAFAGPNNGNGPDGSMVTATSGATASSGSSTTAVGTASSGQSTILNGQVTFGAQWSTLNVQTGSVGGDVIIQGSAGGNALDVTTFNDTHVVNTQEDGSTNIGSIVNAEVSGVGGGVSITSQAFCNSANISTDPQITDVKSDQNCYAQDPGSEINTNVNGVGGDVAIATNAFGNTYSEDTNATNAPVQLHQANSSSVYGTVNSSVHNVAGSVAVTSSAIGNNAQVLHYSTDGAASTGNATGQ